MAIDAKGEPLKEVEVAFTLKGGFNGGTIASALNLAESGAARQLGKRTLLCPTNHNFLIEQPRDPKTVHWDHHFGRWLVPFFMGPVNTRIVRRSAALLNYGPQFRYQEWMQMSGGIKARLTLGALGLFNSGLQSKFGRNLIKLIAPKPGQGPSEENIENGFVKAHFIHRDEQVVLAELIMKICPETWQQGDL